MVEKEHPSPKPLSDQGKLIMEQKPMKGGEGVYIFALVASVIMIIGCFLPWLQVGALLANRGISNPDGTIVLIAALLAGGVALYNLMTKRHALRWLFILAAIAGFAVGIVDLREVSSRAKNLAETWNVNASNFIGSGLYVVMAGAALLAIAGFGSYTKGHQRSALPKPSGIDRIEQPSPTDDETDSSTISVVKAWEKAGRDPNRLGAGTLSGLEKSLKKHWYLYLCGAAILAVLISALLFTFRYSS